MFSYSVYSLESYLGLWLAIGTLYVSPGQGSRGSKKRVTPELGWFTRDPSVLKWYESDLWNWGGLPKLWSADCASLRARGQSPELTERSRHGGSQVCILSWGGRDALMGPWNFLTSQSRLTEEPRVPMKDWLFQKPKWMIPEEQHSRWTSSLHRHMHVPAHTHTLAYTHIHIQPARVYPTYKYTMILPQ